MDKIERFNNLKLDQKISMISRVGAPTNLVRQAGPREIHLYVLGPAYVDVYCNGSGKATDAVAFTDVERINDYLKQIDISGFI